MHINLLIIVSNPIGELIYEEVRNAILKGIGNVVLNGIKAIKDAEPSEIASVYVHYDAANKKYWLIQYNTATGNECARPNDKSNWVCKFSLLIS